MPNQEKDKDNKIINRIIQIVLIIIIILLLLQNCSLMRKKSNKDNDVINNIDIKCDDDKCQQTDIIVDCLKDENNDECIVPNFVGKNKKDVLNWISLVSNNIEFDFKFVKNLDYKDGTILEQSVTGVSVKDLLTKKIKLVITIVNNGSLVDCQKDSENEKCILPNFTNKKKSDVEKWLEGIANNINIKYKYINSSKEIDTIVNQSVQAGSYLGDILNNGETIIIYISSGNKKDSSNKNTNSNEQSNKSNSNTNLEDEFYVSDNKIVKWNDNTDLNIFTDSKKISKVNGKIAPESTGIYVFNVNNKTKYNLKYNISFNESNEYSINMKYKLKKGNTYLVDQYVSYDQLNINDMILNSNKTDIYSLEWKWVGDNDNNDSTIGMSAKDGDINYSLKINIEAESR